MVIEHRRMFLFIGLIFLIKYIQSCLKFLGKFFSALYEKITACSYMFHEYKIFTLPLLFVLNVMSYFPYGKDYKFHLSPMNNHLFFRL